MKTQLKTGAVRLSISRVCKKISVSLMCIVFLLSFTFPVSAQVTLEDLLKRVEALEAVEAENNQLKVEVETLKAEVSVLKGAQASQAVDITDVKARTVTVASVPASPATGNFLKTKLNMELYGALTASGAWSDSDQNGTAVMTNAPRENISSLVVSDGRDINLTAQDTRLGLNIKAPDTEDGGKISGKFEMDFAGSSATSATATTNPVSISTYQPRLRLAYAQLDYEKWGVVAGQNWDFFAPLNASTINAGILYRAGNLGMRHPSAYLANYWGHPMGGTLTSKIGILDTDDFQQEESGIPVSAGYMGYDTRIMGVATTIGLGGLWGRNQGSGTIKKADIWAVTTGLTLKFTDWLSIKGEGYNGAKLDDLQGGFTTGAVGNKAVHSTGGFVELTMKPTKKTETNFGAGQDATRDTQPSLNSSTVWDYNRTYYSNLKYNLSKDLIVAVEYQYFKTKYSDDVVGDANRVMSSLMLKF